MEIQSLSSYEDGLDTHDLNEGMRPVSQEMMDAVAGLFGGPEDPRFDEQQVQELMQFAASEGQMESPGDLLRLMSRLDQASTLTPKHTLLSRAWHAMRTIQAKRALSDLSRLNG